MHQACLRPLQGKELLAFERYMQFRKSGGNHCQINAVPISAAAAEEAEATLERLASQHGFSLQPVPGPPTVSARSLGAAPL